ncbi:MAG: ABC transporter permease, partial [Acidobacteria bacterium]|nr:ABC transporter permease [Acidobacteriota bacterium]
MGRLRARTADQPAAPAKFLDWQRDGRGFDAVAAFNQYQSALNLTGIGEPQELDVTHVTEDFFRVLGIAPVVGRPILPSDRDSDSRLIVLSEHLWRQSFGADPQVIGRLVRLHGESFELIGVMPDAAALGSTPTDAWVRLELTGEQARPRQAHYLRVIAR